jgi:hypothetical protein
MRSASARLIDVVVSFWVNPLLRQQGFVRKRRRWNRRLEGLIQVIAVQAIQTNVHEPSRFTFDLGIHVPGLRAGFPVGAHGPFLSEHQCQVRLRIGNLIPRQLDCWWEVNPSTNPASLGRQVTEVLLAYAIPFMEQSRSPAGLAESLSRVRPYAFAFYGAAIMAHLGDRNRAREILLDVAVQGEYWRDAARRTAEELGIELGQ